MPSLPPEHGQYPNYHIGAFAMDMSFHLYTKNGASCRLDYEDWEHFRRWKWNTKQSKRSHKLYFIRTPGPVKGKPRRSIYLHIEIMKRKEAMPKRRRIVDHINGDSLDCRRDNLRWVTHKQNMASANFRPTLDEHGCSDRFTL